MWKNANYLTVISLCDPFLQVRETSEDSFTSVKCLN